MSIQRATSQPFSVHQRNPMDLKPYPSKRKKNYLFAAFWILLVNFISTSNDVVSTYLGEGLHPFQISFLRFLISFITMIPFVVTKDWRYLKTKMPVLHFWRTFLGAIAVTLGTCSLLKFQIASNTSIMFAEPILFLPLAAIFLKERISAARLFCTLLGIFGIFVVLYKEVFQFNLWLFVPLCSAFLFAGICVIAKKMVDSEPIITSLFYFAFGTTLFSLTPALIVWAPMNWLQIGIVCLLGVNANLIQVCMFKAYSVSEASPLMPLRYLEFVFSFAAGYLIFNQWPTWNVFVGCGLIIASTIIITISEKRQEDRDNQQLY